MDQSPTSQSPSSQSPSSQSPSSQSPSSQSPSSQSPSSQSPSSQSPSSLPRLQFTIARLLACTTLFAVAAWVATVELPLGLTVSPFGKFNLLPIILVTLLVMAAIGVLFQGKPGVRKGFEIGCALIVATVILSSICLSFGELARWLARYF